jgi:hypothetical protein
MEVENKTAEKTAENDRSFEGFIKAAGSVVWDIAKRAWRVEAVKSAALTWAIRAAIPGAPIIYAIIDSYVGTGS